MTVEIDDAIAVAEHEWRRSEVDPRDAEALARDLRLDLEAAGVPPGELIGDVREFARRLAAEAGVRRTPYAYRRVLATTFAGLLLGAVGAYLFVFWVRLPAAFDGPAAVVGYYVVALAALLAGPLLVVRHRLADLPAIGRTLTALAVLLPLAGALATPAAIGLAALLDYQWHPVVVLLECALVGAFLAGAALLARFWAMTPRRRSAAAA